MNNFTAAELNSIVWWAKGSATYYYRRPGFEQMVSLAESIGRKASAWAGFREKTDKGLPLGETPEWFTVGELETVAYWAMDKADKVRNRWDEASRQRLEFCRAISRKALSLRKASA